MSGEFAVWQAEKQRAKGKSAVTRAELRAAELGGEPAAALEDFREQRERTQTIFEPMLFDLDIFDVFVKLRSKWAIFDYC